MFFLFRTARSITVKVNVNLTNNDEVICQELLVSCSSPENLLWAAPLFVDGMPVALAAMISSDWLLAPHSSLIFNEYVIIILNIKINLENVCFISKTKKVVLGIV